jgi:predicted metal-dependent hydrolase
MIDSIIIDNIPIIITRKWIKNIYIEVNRQAQVECRVPFRISQKEIDKFISSKLNWIKKHINQRLQVQERANEIRSQNSLRILGEEYDIVLEVGEPQIVIKDNTFSIHVRDIKDIKEIKKTFLSWWEHQASALYCAILDKLFGQVFPRGYKKPSLRVRWLKTLWGSYKRTSNLITINATLLKADVKAIESVILHELTHIVYAYHNQFFYQFMTKYMPDWREREKELKHLDLYNPKF